ncbi:YlaH-like family protein [Alteribacter aurantiacus]|uniref:YlaH-like family protein n=1 Tax=Alteribacter aurantiacus TaxID=254410 RepID=UPI00041764B1|nr:YlaH-like family protein [Alteribacter aurantiacus]
MLLTIKGTPGEYPLTPIAELFGAQDPTNFLFAYWALFVIVNILSVLVFNLGFARKLPILKNVVIYLVMLFGNMFITFLAFSMPIIEALFIAAIVLGVYRFQMRKRKQEEHVETVDNQ